MKGPYEIHDRGTGLLAYLGKQARPEGLSRRATVMMLSTVVDDEHLDRLVVMGSDDENRMAREFLTEAAASQAAERDQAVDAVCREFISFNSLNDAMHRARAERLAKDWPELFVQLNHLINIVLAGDDAEA